MAVLVNYQKSATQPLWLKFLWFEAALLLLCLQIATGCQLLYALLVFVFSILIYYAVKVLGGLNTLLGICVLYFGAQNILISQVAKIFFWEPADAPLSRPIETILANDCYAGAILAAALLSNYLLRNRPRPLFTSPTDSTKLYSMAIIALLFSLIRGAALAKFGSDSTTGSASVGGAVGPLRAVSFLPELAVASATAYYIISSNGRKTFGWMNGIAIAANSAVGLIGSSRQGIGEGFLIYAVTLFIFRVKLRPVHYILLVSLGLFAQYILFPYALYARAYTRTPDMDKNISRAASIFMDVVSNPDRYQPGQTKESINQVAYQYYGKPIPTLDRMSTIVYADGVIDGALENGYTGWTTLQPGFESIIPRFLLPQKELISPSNFLAHQAKNMVGRNDFGTGIVVGPVADAFCSFGWVGVIVLPFLTTLAFFVVTRFLISDVIWKSVVVAAFAFEVPWEFAGGLVSSLIQLVTFWVLVSLVTFLVIELLTQLFKGRPIQQKLPSRQPAPMLPNRRPGVVDE